MNRYPRFLFVISVTAVLINAGCARPTQGEDPPSERRIEESPGEPVADESADEETSQWHFRDGSLAAEAEGTRVELGDSGFDSMKLHSEVVLEPVHTAPGYAYQRFALSNGDIVQMHSGCNEGAAGGEGFVVRRGAGGDDFDIVAFDSGPGRELDSGYLLIESRRQVANDMTDETPDVPDSLGATHWDHTGSLFVFRLIAIDVASGQEKSTPWGSFAPATAGEENFVVYAMAAHNQEHFTDPRVASAVYLWDVNTGESKLIAECDAEPHFRRHGNKIIVMLVCKNGAQIVVVDPTNGTFADTAFEEYEEAEDYEMAEPVPLQQDQDLTYDANGREILFPPTHFHHAPHTAMVRMCGLGPWIEEELLFTDEGVFQLPQEVEWADD